MSWSEVKVTKDNTRELLFPSVNRKFFATSNFEHSIADEKLSTLIQDKNLAFSIEGNGILHSLAPRSLNSNGSNMYVAVVADNEVTFAGVAYCGYYGSTNTNTWLIQDTYIGPQLATSYYEWVGGTPHYLHRGYFIYIDYFDTFTDMGKGQTPPSRTSYRPIYFKKSLKVYAANLNDTYKRSLIGEYSLFD